MFIGYIGILYIVGKPILHNERYNKACETITSRIFEDGYNEDVLMGMALDIFKNKYYQQSVDARDLIAIVYKHLGKFEKVIGVENTRTSRLTETQERFFLMTCHIKFSERENPIPFHVNYIMDESNIRLQVFLMHDDAFKRQLYGEAADFMTRTKK